MILRILEMSTFIQPVIIIHRQRLLRLQPNFITASNTAPKVHSNGKDATWEVTKLIQPESGLALVSRYGCFVTISS
jgi:hypothetical protein